MFDEKWIAWHPTNRKLGNLSLVHLLYKKGNLDLRFFDHSTRAEYSVKFVDVLAFRVADEGDMLKMLGHLAKNGTRFYRASNSKYIKWFLEQNSNVRQDQKLKHYVLTTIDDIIEVIDFEEPTFDVLESR